VRRVLIVNPGASRVTKARLAAVERVLAPVDVLRTEHPGHAVELVSGLTDAERIYVFSGDGGYNEALNGSDGVVPLGLIPGGGTNVLPRALGLPRDPVEAARVLVSGTSRRISLGRVNGRRFGFAAGLGVDAELMRRAGRTRRGRRKSDLAVAWAALGLLVERRGRFEPTLEIRGHGEAAFALVANSDPYTYVGRAPVHVTPEARLELGLDFVAPPRLRRRDYPGVLRYLLGGDGRLELLRGHDLDRLEIACREPMPLQVDGEDLGDVTEAVFEAERDAVSLLVPHPAIPSGISSPRSASHSVGAPF
jgi:diacylglycerol kinase family enzyme